MSNSLEDVLIAMRRVIRATDLHSKFLAKTTGLTTPQMLLLQAVSNKGPVTIGTLANEISLSQATVTSILDRLESRGLVSRVRSTEDKRRVHVHLADTAVSLLKHAPVPLQRQFAEQFGSLQEWEQSMIVSALQRVAQMMDANELEAAPLLHAGAMDKPGEAEER